MLKIEEEYTLALKAWRRKKDIHSAHKLVASHLGLSSKNSICNTEDMVCQCQTLYQRGT